jgi:hypothetical protein
MMPVSQHETGSLGSSRRRSNRHYGERSNAAISQATL